MYWCGLMCYRQTQYVASISGVAKPINSYFWLIVFFFAIMCGIRYRCGVDCEYYVSGFLELKHGIPLSNHDRSFEPLFVAISQFLAWIGAGRVLYLGAFAFIEVFTFYYALKTRNYLYPFIGLALILGPYFGPWNNGIRQVIASCIFVLATVTIVDGNKGLKRYVEYALLIGLAALVHKSALMLLPFVLLVFYNRVPNRLVALTLLLLSVYVGHNEVLNSTFAGVDKILYQIGYESYSEKIYDLWEAEGGITAYGPRRIAMLLSYIMIILYSKNMDRYVNGDKFYRVSYLLFLIYACISEAMISHSSLFSRPAFYFMPFCLISSAYLFSFLKGNGKIGMYILFALLVCTFFLMNNVGYYSTPDETALYKYIFFNR